MNSETRFAPIIDRFGSRLILDVDRLPGYFHDVSEINARPDAIFFAETEPEVIAIINLCRKSKIPIVFRGAGTGYTGGAVPSPSCLVLSLEKLRKLKIEPEKYQAFCGPGLITKELMDKAAEFSLFYPPDPASYDESTLGGNVAENAGGLHCKKYGVTKDYIIGLRAVTIEGELLKTGVYSDRDLLDITGIIIGSEGLLAAVTEIAVRLIDVPKTGATILAAFGSPENAARTVSQVTDEGIVPSVMEYMDGDAVQASNRYEHSLEIDQAGAILLFETSGENADKQSKRIYEICREHNAGHLKKEDNPAAAENLWKIRRNLSKAVKASAREKIAEDVCVPPSKLPELVAFVAQLNQEYPIRVNSYGHAGDGNLHVNFLIENVPVDSALIDEGVKRLFEKTLELGGTLTGEHGIGLTKKRFLHLEFDSPTLRCMKRIKNVFDPAHLLNPGKMFCT